MRRVRRVGPILLAVVVALLGFARWGGSWLVIDAPERGDAIVVLIGENDVRQSRGVELLRQGFGQRLIFDVPAEQTVYGLPLIDLARQFIRTLPPELAGRSDVCPMDARSTQQEARAMRSCVQRLGAHSILVVTSDYHTRRALTIVRHECPQYRVSVAAARDRNVYRVDWWRRREPAKNFLYEWAKLLWFEAVDRWRH